LLHTAKVRFAMTYSTGPEARGNLIIERLTSMK
jgi:hypothetical protein